MYLNGNVQNKKNHSLLRISHDTQYLYINCGKRNQIYCYSLAGKYIKSYKYTTTTMEIVNNQFYLLDASKFFIVDIPTDSVILSFKLQITNSGGTWYLKVDRSDIIYFTPSTSSHYIFVYDILNGKEIKKFGNMRASQNEGEFNQPAGITLNNKCLYICDSSNHRLQVIDKENGNFIRLWKDGKRAIHDPRSIVLNEQVLYVGDAYGIQAFTKRGRFIQVFGKDGSGEGEFKVVTGVCILNDKLYCIDYANYRIQVWK